jgi:hypothetical protein
MENQMEKNQGPLSDGKTISAAKKLEFKKIFEENISATTIHGIYDIYRNEDYLLKAIIAICFLASGGFCFYMTVSTFMDFFSYGPQI